MNLMTFSLFKFILFNPRCHKSDIHLSSVSIMLVIVRQTAARSARRVVAGAVSGLFGVAAPASAGPAWRRERHDNSDSDPVAGQYHTPTSA